MLRILSIDGTSSPRCFRYCCTFATPTCHNPLTFTHIFFDVPQDHEELDGLPPLASPIEQELSANASREVTVQRDHRSSNLCSGQHPARMDLFQHRQQTEVPTEPPQPPLNAPLSCDRCGKVGHNSDNCPIFRSTLYVNLTLIVP